MEIRRFLLILLFLGCALIGRAHAGPGDVTDLISPVFLEAGKSDTLLISDLFYARDYCLRLRKTEGVSAKYDRQSGQLILRTGPQVEGFTTLGFELHGREYHVPIVSRIKQTRTFRFKPEHRPQSRMNLMGTFNDWNRTSLPMQDDDGDGVYEIALKLDPGQYLYQFVIDDREIYDPENPRKVDNGFGSYNSVVQVAPRHKERIHLHILGLKRAGNGATLRFYLEHSLAAGAPEARVTALLDNQVLPARMLESDGDTIRISLPDSLLTGMRVLRVAATGNGLTSNLQTVRLVDGVPPGRENSFSDWHDAIIYSLMVDRFFDGDPANSRPVLHDSLDARANYMGGDLQGILDKLRLGYFDSLGVTVLWLSPVVENTDHAFREWPAPHRYYSAYHGYWPTHPTRVEERFGDMVLLKQVVREAHDHGMKVLLDFIANHAHQEHPFFREHRNWFGTYELPDGRKNIRLWDEFRLTTWFEPFLPSFDYVGSPAAVEAMTDNAIWWLKETGIDGFRHDAVKHIPNSFWRTLTRKIKEQVEVPRGEKIYQIGETFGSYKLIGSYVNRGQLDAQFNFNLYDTAVYVFLNQDAGFDILARELEKGLSIFGPDNLMGNFMDSHDKTRFISYADGDVPPGGNDAQEIGWQKPPEVDHPASYEMTKLYLTYLLTIPGVPVLFYGDEFGMPGAGDPDNRRMMRFDGQLSRGERKMLRQVQALVRARRSHPALRYGDFQTLRADKHIFAFLRSDLNERVLVVLNKSSAAQPVDLQLPRAYGVESAENVLTHERVAVRASRLRLRVPALSGTILRVK